MRTRQKELRWVVRRLVESTEQCRVLAGQVASLRATRAELAEIELRLDPELVEALAATADRSRKGARGAGYSLQEVEHMLADYLPAWARLGPTRAAVSADDLDPVDLDLHNDFFQNPGRARDPVINRLAGLDHRRAYVESMPRTRNALGRRLSEPAAGRKNRGKLPRGPSRVDAVFARRIDLQRAMFTLAPKTRETLYLHGVVGLTFAEVADIQGISPQAVHKAYRRALRLLQQALILGAPLAGDERLERYLELRLVERAQTAAVAKLAWYAQRGARMAGQLVERQRLLAETQLEAEAWRAEQDELLAQDAA